MERLGTTTPEGLPSYGGGIFHYDDNTGMEYNVHETKRGVLLAACHDAVGIVYWYQFENVEDAWTAIEAGN